jgi:hypothetical protein
MLGGGCVAGKCRLQMGSRGCGAGFVPGIHAGLRSIVVVAPVTVDEIYGGGGEWHRRRTP